MKRILTVFIAVIAVFSLASCSSRKYADLKIANIGGFGNNIINKTSFDDQLVETDDREYAAKLLNIDPQMINTVDGQLEIFRSAGATPPEEVIIVGAKDAEAAKSIVNGAFADRVKNLRNDFSELDPDQLPKINSCVKMAAGRYAFLVISNDNAAAKKALKELLDTAAKIHD